MNQDGMIMFSSAWSQPAGEKDAVIPQGSEQWYIRHANSLVMADTLLNAHTQNPHTDSGVNKIALDNLTDAIQVVTQYLFMTGSFENRDELDTLNKGYESALKFISRRYEHLVNADASKLAMYFTPLGKSV